MGKLLLQSVQCDQKILLNDVRESLNDHNRAFAEFEEDDKIADDYQVENCDDQLDAAVIVHQFVDFIGNEENSTLFQNEYHAV